ncbi:MAG: EamA family transporter [Eubacterium sp.]|nr:EamA family transporter [Eubacterium sp.]
MWLVFAFGSALFAGLTAILAKCGIRHTDSTVATAIRTIVVLIFAWIMVFITGAQTGLNNLSRETLLFLILSGLATGASWLCYFHALQIGDVNKVVPVDKSSIILTIVLAFILFHETVSATKLLGLAAIGIGTYLMIELKKEEKTPETITDDSGASVANPHSYAHSHAWLFFALGSAVFASLTSILGKMGVTGIDSNLGTAIRTGVVLVMAWVMVFVTGKQKKIHGVEKKELAFICLSGLATGGSWLCYYRALQDGPASLVVPIDKLSILVTIAFSWIVFHERLSKRSAIGLIAIVAGTLIMLI